MEEEKNISSKIEERIIVILIVVYLVLSEGLNFGSIIIKIPFLIVGFYLSYFIFLFGLKLFKIKHVPKNKIYIYILSILILDLVFNFISPAFLKLFPADIFIFNILNFVTYSFFTIMFFRYYLLFSTKQVLRLLFYFIILSFILITLINKILFF